MGNWSWELFTVYHFSLQQRRLYEQIGLRDNEEAQNKNARSVGEFYCHGFCFLQK